MNMTTKLQSCLDAFRTQVNSNRRMDTLLKGWDRDIMVESTAGEVMTMAVRSRQINALTKGAAGLGDVVHVRGDEAVLVDIFTGVMIPAKAYLDGVLEVFGSDKDMVKLDAISMVLWGA